MTLNVDKFGLFLKTEVILLLGELGSGGLLNGVHGGFLLFFFGAYVPDILIALTLQISLWGTALQKWNKQERLDQRVKSGWIQYVHICTCVHNLVLSIACPKVFFAAALPTSDLRIRFLLQLGVSYHSRYPISRHNDP
jgi:hypothetical protein